MRIQLPALVKMLSYGITACLFVTFASRFTPSQQARPQPKQSNTSTRLSDPAELEAFLDGVMAAHKEDQHIAGATVAVVANGRLFFAKGYGYADFGKKTKVDPDKTLFRIASVSKLFTWTAVMQLVEQRKLDLNADVNNYLTEFKIPNTYPQPITLAHLMSHTPGFEDHVIGLFARSPDRLLPLGKLLADEMPARVRPPGQLASYSNYGAALAGYIVERVSGVPWEEYVEKNILQPLEMEHTTARQPIPTELAGDMAAGYSYMAGEFKQKEFEFIPLRAAGSMSASAVDMAHFMIAHLQDGQYRSGRILSEDTAQEMHRQLFTHAMQINGMLHGFIEMNRNGQRIFGHGGDTIWFHSELALLPEQNVGLFVSYNSDTGAKPRNELVRAFIDRYYPASDSSTSKPAARFQQYVKRFEGSYTSLRVSRTTLAKLGALLDVVRVSATEDGQLWTRGRRIEPKRWIEIEPLVFREVDGQERLAFRQDGQGRITHLFFGSFPPIAFVKLDATERPVFHFIILGVCALLLLSGAVLWPVGALRQRRKAALTAVSSRFARLVAWVMCAFCVAFLTGGAVLMAEPAEITFGIPVSLRILLVLPLLASVFMLGVLLFTVLAWKKGYWSFAARVHYTLVTLAGLVLLWWLNYWNLLGFHFK